MRERLYRSGWRTVHRLDRPSVSVGALAVGGTGKTPCTVALCGLLLKSGLRPAVLSRGYKRRGGGPLLISSGDGDAPRHSAEVGGDEPVLIARQLPDVAVAVAARREAAARLVPTADVDVYVLDDAFQHLRVARDVDCLVVDGDRPFWDDRPMPAGRLRERPEAAARADAFLLVGEERAVTHAELARRFPGRSAFELVAEPPVALPFGAEGPALEPPDWPGPLFAFAGIARPERFWTSLAATGAEIAGVRAFPDHHRFTGADLADLARRAAAASAGALVTTEKDAVRLPAEGLPGPPLLVVRHRLRATEPRRLQQWLLERLRR